MTSDATSTSKPKEYLGLNLGALQALESEGMVVESTSASHPGEVHSELAQDAPTQIESAPLPPPSEASMQDYYQLQQNLLGLTVAFGAVIFPFVWGFYSLQIALDYILGACAGVDYLRMLGRNVSKIGRQKKNSSVGRLAVFAAIMLVSLRRDQLDVIHVCLGFLTYKAAIIAFVLWTSVMPQREAT